MPNRLVRTVVLLICVVTATACLFGQVFPRDENPTIPVQASWMKPLTFPSGISVLEIPLTLDPSSSGNDLLHVWTPEGVPISLRLPSGTIVDANNAQGLGFEFGQVISDGGNPAGDDFGGMIEIGAVPGTHTVIVFPENQAAGTYHLIADTSAKTVTFGGIAEWHSTSPLVAGCQTEATLFRAGDAVTVVCVVAEEQTPVANATLSGEIQPQVEVGTSVTVGGAQLIRKEDDGEGFSLYVYRLNLQNNSGLDSRFIATAESSADDVTIVSGEVGFDTIAAGQSGSSLNELQVSAPTTPGFDPATLSWRVVGAGSPIVLALTDAGPGNDGLGDGIYSGQFTPNQVGTYSIRVELTGTSPASRPFFRVVLTEIEVIEQPATIGATTDSGVDANGNGKAEAIRINTALNVTVGGEYVLNFSMVDAQERQYGVTRVLALEPGSQLDSVEFPTEDLARAGLSNGPYEIRGMVLSRRVDGRETVSDYSPLAHTTDAYDLGDFDRGSLYFTGQASEQALNTDGVAGYDVLRLQAEVIQVPGVASGTMRCRVSASLTDAAGFTIDAVEGEASTQEGPNWLTLDFRGPKIARSNINGPYQVRAAKVNCSGMEDNSATLLATSPYLASDFAAVPPDFYIDLPGITLKPGEQRHVLLAIRSVGAYEGTVTVSTTGASPGLSPSLVYPQVQAGSQTLLSLAADSGVVPGSYIVEVAATDGTLTRAVSVPVVVSSQDANVSVTSSAGQYLHPGMSSVLTAAVQNVAEQGVTWSITPGTGTFTPNGNSATYSIGAVSAAFTEHIQANSVFDPSRAGVAVLRLFPPVTITLTPENPMLRAGQWTWVNATLTNNGNQYDPSLNWTVNPQPGAGGSAIPYPLQLRYTAPSTIPVPQTVAVSATFAEDPAALGTATLTLLPDIQVTLAPTAATLFPAEASQFSATVSYDPSNAGVAYALSPQVGSVDASGLYIAPSSIASETTVTLTAASVADPTKTATATITLRPLTTVSVAPATALLSENQTQQFTATVQTSGDPSVNWTVSPSVGSVSATGLYTAPASVATQQTVTVTATSVSDPAKSASALVTLHPSVSVSVSPTSTTLGQSQSQQFTPTVTNAANTAVTWSISPSVGSVNASGLYTAPSSIATQQTVTVTATSVEDPSKSANATITLKPPVSVSVSPINATLGQNQAQQFTATVTNATNTSVNWTRSPAVGTVSASGLYAAPASITLQQIVTVTAISVEDPSKSASATVTLKPPVFVSVSPTSATLSQNQTRQFTATVTNATNTAVTWTRSPAVGTISAGGLYAAPASIVSQQTVTVTATSVEDATKSASATVTLTPPPNQAPWVSQMSPANSSGWANVFRYNFIDPNGATDIAQAEVVYSTSSNPPLNSSCWFVYTRSTNSVRLYNDSGTGFVSGSIAANSSDANLQNSRCTLIGGSLQALPSGNTLSIFLGIGFSTGTARTYTARMKAIDSAGAATGYSSMGTWTIPAASTPPSSPEASGSGTPSASISVSLIDTNNVSVDSVDVDDIQTLISKTGASTYACHFYYFAPAEMIVLLDDDDVHWAGVSKAGMGGGAIGNTRCLVNAAQAYKTYDYNTKRFGIVVPVTAFGTFTGTKYVYVGGSDRSGNIVSTSWVHSWTTY